jgi:hypothetical protein
MVLKDVRDILYSMGKDIRDYGLPPICDEGPSSIDMMKEVREEEDVSVDQDHLDILILLIRSREKGLMKSFSMSSPIRARFFFGWSGRHGQDVLIQGPPC